MVKDEKVIAHYTAIVKKINPSLTKDERISNQLLMADEWTPESGDLSPTLKLKRRVLREKYKAEIQQIYGRELESSVAQ